jgi:trimethylamine--corrinoid protein Co-methyltransferase
MNRSADQCTHRRLRFRVLADTQIESVYRATLECLDRTGVNVLNAEARELLIDAGSRADGVRVRIPPRIIQDAVEATPNSFKLWGRPVGDSREQDARYCIDARAADLVEGVPDGVYFGPGPTCTYFIDPETGERRKARQGDPGLTAQVCDALDNIDYVMGLALIDNLDHQLAPVREFAEIIFNTRKPILAWAYSVENVSDLHHIALAVAGSEQALRHRPFFALFSTFQSPLQHTDEDLANALWAAGHGIPVVYLGGGCAGCTAPITGASTLVITLAGMLSGLAAVQLKQQGAPVCVGGVPQAMDLLTARPPYGGPELSLYSAALSDICRYHALPYMGTAGASEAKGLDVQAAIESAMEVLLSGLSGATLVHDIGFLDCADIGSLELLVMSDEIVGWARRIMRGIEVSDETLMLDLIDKVGPGGHFMAEKETAERCREEVWMPRLADRDAWADWKAAGGKKMEDRVRLRLQTILATHEPPPLPGGVPEQIATILQRAEARATGS